MRAGGAWLTASVEQGATRLTRGARTAHRGAAAMRTGRRRAGGRRGVRTGSYGGGLLGGDVVALHVQRRRVAALTTQASTKVYGAGDAGAGDD